MRDIFGELIRRIEHLESAVNQQDRRQNNTIREGVVTDVYPGEGLARVDAHGVVTKKVPWLERSGSIREWTPPAKGERVVLLSPTGEPGQGMILPGGYSDNFPAPHNAGSEKRTTIGNVTVTQSGSALIISAGGVTVEISGAGMTITGGTVIHDGKNIGKDHKHGGVVPGGAITDVPV